MHTYEVSQAIFLDDLLTNVSANGSSLQWHAGHCQNPKIFSQFNMDRIIRKGTGFKHPQIQKEPWKHVAEHPSKQRFERSSKL